MADATAGADADTLAELAKRRGFFFPANEAYGGASGFYTYGPEGAALKRNLEASWRERFVTREDNMEISSPTVTPESVFEASGHLDGFDDMILECPECGANHRADHLVEDNTEIEEAESFGTDRIAELVAEHGIACPSCGTELAGESVEAFNLMFETTIGPGSSSPGYLRPETAQGIFVEFPRLAEYARNQLPFGVAQIGHGYRNEISPRRSLIRVREFTMAELEQFVDPESDAPPIERVEDVTLPLYSAVAQEGEGSIERMSVAEALDRGVVESEWIAYYLGIATEWYEAVGVDIERFRYRQHLPDELSHYASDCWDAEAELDDNWIEITGFADRGAYDLSKHDSHSDEAFSVFRPYDETKTVERPSVEPDMSYLGPEFGADAGDVADELAALAERNPSAFDGDEVAVELDGEQYELPTEKTGFAVRSETITGEHVTPHVIEPSFGMGRVLYTVLVHSYREDEVEGEPRSYLALPSELAPTFVGVFPLMDKDGLGERANEIAADLRAAGFAVEYDDSGNIGRRYRRQDEVGTPYCVTVDYESLDEGTVTVRERDSTAQTRIAIDELPARLTALRAGESLVD
ncbi:glycine--tRNA ligase [Halococcus thailandensis]|uniref:glycine--tRNA ligase n=1 Tax=Halococcus thailandensis JCM 13552 TaxID=1227457 RepID=M0N8U8_9EURY|nr:glycine--tRNA ligase [Halococcus thailandensis]EMA53065.1 glycyl-tRNA ligase [Halococcus thailandensis JCM 13552]